MLQLVPEPLPEKFPSVSSWTWKSKRPCFLIMIGAGLVVAMTEVGSEARREFAAKGNLLLCLPEDKDLIFEFGSTRGVAVIAYLDRRALIMPPRDALWLTDYGFMIPYVDPSRVVAEESVAAYWDESRESKKGGAAPPCSLSPQEESYDSERVFSHSEEQDLWCARIVTNVSGEVFPP